MDIREVCAVCLDGTCIIVNADFDTTGKDLTEGDYYIAKRNYPMWSFLTCKSVNTKKSLVIPKELLYLYRFDECHKVVGFVRRNESINHGIAVAF